MRLIRTVRLPLFLVMAFVLTGFPSRNGIAGTVQQDNAETYNQQGLALMAAEKFEEAAKVFKEAIKLKPDFVDANYHLGDTYFELGEVKKAIEAYKQAIRYKPDFALAYNQLGTAYRAASDYKKAIDAYNESIRLDPKAQLTHYNLGTMYAERNKEQSALAEYKILQPMDAGLAQDLYNSIYKPTVPILSDGAVRLNVLAVDSHGAPVPGLTSEDFQVVEDGAVQTVSVASKRDSVFYGLAVDTSGSMRPAFPLVIASSKYIVEKAHPQDQTLLVRFISSDKIETVQEFTSNKRRLMNGIDTLYIEGGQSAVLDAVYVAAQRLAGYKFPDQTVRRVLFLLTDGDDRQSYYNLPQVVDLLRSLDVQIFAVSLSTDNRSGGKLNQNQPKRFADLLKTLASETGGAAFFPGSPAELKATLDQVFDLVRSEYTIEYKPAKPGKAHDYRPVSVTIAPKPQREKWSVIARPGYVVSKK